MNPFKPGRTVLTVIMIAGAAPQVLAQSDIGAAIVILVLVFKDHIMAY